jgi:hypothetical protein
MFALTSDWYRKHANASWNDISLALTHKDANHHSREAALSLSTPRAPIQKKWLLMCFIAFWSSSGIGHLLRE